MLPAVFNIMDLVYLIIAHRHFKIKPTLSYNNHTLTPKIYNNEKVYTGFNGCPDIVSKLFKRTN